MWSIRNKAGFTLIELILVIILAGIIAAVVVPRINTDAGQVPPAADIVASDVQYTQMYAMTNNTSACITLVPGATYNYAGAWAGGVCTGGSARNLAAVGPNVTISAGQTLAFNSLGEPYGLAAAATITVANGAATKQVVVNAYTGKVTVQ